jgi:dTDP-4-amino-4,6-dideoxygalactose transaminase/ubiquinone/menaquinone biosynthesis C-methylase UbiE
MTDAKIPLTRPFFDEGEVEAVRRVLRSGWVVQGPEVEAFESAVAAIHQARHCVAVSSGTAALHVSYLALGIGPGDAVFVPSFAWPSAANMAVLVGARPVFVDVLPDTYNMDPVDLRRRILECEAEKWGTPRLVVPVHQFGLAADMDAILTVAGEYRLDVLEDAACAFGAAYKGKPVGTCGRIGILSFHPRKAITTGEGGAILTDDDSLAERCRMWRNHGQVLSAGDRDFHVAGLNYRMTDIQAAIGGAQLEKFPEILKKRAELAQQYLAKLADCPEISLPSNCPGHTWQTFMVVLDDRYDRDAVARSLMEAGFGAAPGSVAGHCMGVYRDRFRCCPGDLRVSARLHSQGLALPVHALMETWQVETCALAVRRALSGHRNTAGPRHPSRVTMTTCGDEIRAYWDKKADQLRTDPRATMKDVILRNMEIDAVACRLCPEDVLLDIGCGNAFGSLAFAEHCKSVLALDYSEKMVEAAREAITRSGRANIRAERGDVLAIASSFRQVFSAVTCIRCLINLPTEAQQYAAIEQLATVLLPGGRLFLLEGIAEHFAFMNLMRERAGLGAIRLDWHNRLFQKDRLEDALRQVVTVEEIVDFGEYYFLSRVVHPLMTAPEEPKFEARFNEVAKTIWKSGLLRGQFVSTSTLMLYVCRKP